MRRRPGISARANDPTSWAAKRMPISSPDVSVPPPVPERERRHHPTIQPPERKCFRVVRRYRRNGEFEVEDIGAFSAAAPALQLLARELGNAVLLEPNGKPSAQNWQPIEIRQETDPMPPTSKSASPLLDQQPPAVESPAPPPAAPPSAVPMKARAPRKLKAVPPDASMFERLARDPSVDVEKLERLIAMQERILSHQAKAAFDAAFAEMQGEIPVITEKGEIVVEGQLRSKYATNEDIQEIVKPILQKHGFSLRFRNAFADGKQKIVGILSHRAGHSEQDEFECPPDTSGKKNSIQAMGSTRSYGQRYTTIALLNIATRGADDDGASATEQEAPKAPDGYEAWASALPALAEDGWPALSGAFNKAKPEFRAYLTTHHKQQWEYLKRQAQQKAKAS